jgi:chromosome segregation ATPase
LQNRKIFYKRTTYCIVFQKFPPYVDKWADKSEFCKWLNKDLLNQFRQIVREGNAPLKERLDRQDKKLDERGRDIKSIKQDVSTLQKDVTTLKQDVSTLQKDVATIKDVQQVHGEKLDRVEDGQNRQHTVLKTLQGAVEETRAEVDKIRRRPQQAD